MKRIRTVAVIAVVALFAACDTVPRQKLTLTFNDAGDRVTIESTTTLPPLKDAKNRTAVEQLRDALLGGRDEWALRFQHAGPERDRVSYERTAGDLTEVTRSATIDADDLQKFFYDLPITTKVVRGDGWVELAIYPGTSNRATREEREDFDKRMAKGARAARRYIDTMRMLYAHLDEHPQRAHDVFDALLRSDDEPRRVVVTEHELALIKQIREAIDALLQVDWNSVNREADDVENPFPAEIVVKTPTAPTLIEGFDHDERGVFIQPKSLLDAVAGLEGRWIYPDLIAVALREHYAKTEELVELFEKSSRRAESVVGLQEVAAGLTEQLKPADHYRVRFRTK